MSRTPLSAYGIARLAENALAAAADAIASGRQARIRLLVDGTDAAPASGRAAGAPFVFFLTRGFLPLAPFVLGGPRPFATLGAATPVTIAGIRARWSR